MKPLPVAPGGPPAGDFPDGNCGLVGGGGLLRRRAGSGSRRHGSRHAGLGVVRGGYLRRDVRRRLEPKHGAVLLAGIQHQAEVMRLGIGRHRVEDLLPHLLERLLPVGLLVVAEILGTALQVLGVVVDLLHLRLTFGVGERRAGALQLLLHGLDFVVQLLERLAQDDRIEISCPSQNMQVKLVRSLPNGNDFVAYIDAIGNLDGNRCLLEWKTTTSRYPEEPDGLLALDPQLICYSWMSGISEVALIAFVRKRFSEIQYLKTTITEQQREEFGHMVEVTASHIEAGEFLPHSGIRFPQNGCVSCPQLGLCLGNEQLVESKLIRRPGASDLDWLDQLVD